MWGVSGPGGFVPPTRRRTPARSPPRRSAMTRLAVRALGLLALALALTPAQARAGVILQPASASTDMGTVFGSPDNVRNQSGLNSGYTSGATDFDSYVAGNPTHD